MALEEASPTAIPGHLPRTGRETCLVQPFLRRTSADAKWMDRSPYRTSISHGWRNRPGRPSENGSEDRNQHHGNHSGLTLNHERDGHREDGSEGAHPDCHHQQQHL